MERDREHVGAAVEALLRAVAVVDVPVDDGDALDPARPRPLGDEGLVGEEAEAVGLGRLGVVAGRPNERVGDPGAPVEHRVCRLEAGPGSGEQRVPRAGADVGRLREAPAAALARLLDRAAGTRGSWTTSSSSTSASRPACQRRRGARGPRSSTELHVPDSLDVLGMQLGHGEEGGLLRVEETRPRVVHEARARPRRRRSGSSSARSAPGFRAIALAYAMWPKNSPASERRRASALRASAVSAPIRPVSRSDVGASVDERQHVAERREPPRSRGSAASRRRTRLLRRVDEAADDPAVVDQERHGRIDTRLERVVVAVRAGGRRVVAVEDRQPAAGRRTRKASANASSGPGTWQSVVWKTTTSNVASSSGSARASPSTKVRLPMSPTRSFASSRNRGDGSRPTTSPTPGHRRGRGQRAPGRSRPRAPVRRAGIDLERYASRISCCCGSAARSSSTSASDLDDRVSASAMVA